MLAPLRSPEVAGSMALGTSPSTPTGSALSTNEAPEAASVTGGHEMLRAIGSERWALLAASSVGAALQFARSLGIEPVLVLTGPEVLALGVRGLRRLQRQHGIRVLVAHSRSWRSQIGPQLFELALVVSPAPNRFVVDEETERTTSFGTRGLFEA
jgi:hypothetical protein